MSSQRTRSTQDARLSVLQKQNYMLSELSEQLQDSNHQKDEYIGQLEQKLFYMRTHKMHGKTNDSTPSPMIMDIIEELQRQVVGLQAQLSQTDANVAAIPLARVEVLETMVEHQASQIQTLQHENSQLWEHLNDVDILSARGSPPQVFCDSSSRASNVYQDTIEFLGSESMEFLSSRDHLATSLRSDLGASKGGRQQRRRSRHRHDIDETSCHSHASSTGNNAFLHNLGKCSALGNAGSCSIPSALSHYHSRSLIENDNDFLIGYNSSPNQNSPPNNSTRQPEEAFFPPPGTEAYAVDSLSGESFDDVSGAERHLFSLRSKKASDHEESVEEAKEALQTLVAFLDNKSVSSKPKESFSMKESNQPQRAEEVVAIIEASSIPDRRKHSSLSLLLGQLPWNGKNSDAEDVPLQETTETSIDHTSCCSSMVENFKDDASTFSKSSMKRRKGKASNKKSTIPPKNTLFQWKSSSCVMSRSPWVSA